MDIIELTDTGKSLQLQWADGTRSRFPHEWLRDNCNCAQCGTTLTGARFLRLTDFPRQIHPENSRLETDGDLAVRWSHGGHRSRYTSAWLYDHRLQSDHGDRCRPLAWNRQISDSLPRVSRSELTDSDTASVRLMETLYQFGFVLIHQVPATDQAIIELAELLGIIHPQSYASVFDIWTRDNEDILSNTRSALSPHVDEPFLTNPPGLFLLHCLKPGDDGTGANVLVDGFMLGKTLREQDPDAFRTLCQIPIAHHRHREGHFDHHANATVFELDAKGEVARFRFAERSAAPVVGSESLVERIYAARRALLNLAYAPEFQLELTLSRGDALLIDNHRLMHGRRAFGGQRHLRQCNIHRDDAWSRYRIACRARGRRPVA